MCSKFGVKEWGGIIEGSRASGKAMFGRAAVATATLILYTSLTAGFLGVKGCPQRQDGIDNIICNRSNDVVITLIEGPKAVVDGERISTRIS